MRRYIALLAFLALAPPALPQDARDLRRLARDAGLIFSGTVERMERVAPATRGDIGLVRVTFRVRDAIRGATPGEALTISEWDGLWMGRDRYRAGESLLLFFYAPSSDLGLTTTVGGEQGRISLAGRQLSMVEIARQIADEDATTSALGKPRPERPPRPRARGPSQE